jgi:glycosyltransferase involved in cell wall biosynthesis
LKSLHIIGSKAMGGAERWYARFLDALQRRGHAVHAAVRRDSELAVHHLRGIPTATLPMRTVWDPLSKWEVSRHVAKVDAPIVQTYMGRATRLTHLRAGRRVHVARLGGYYKLKGFRHAHAWVGNTRGLCDWLVENGFPHERVFHIYNFVEPARPVAQAEVDALRAQLKLAPEDCLLLVAGRFVEVKGHDVLLDAVARLPAEVRGRRLRVLLLGDGPLTEALQRQAGQLNIAERLVWCGWQQHPAAWFQLADLIVFPSRDQETFGNVILEGWSFGKPVVATAFRGAREIARHGSDCWVVPCEDAPALARGIQAVLADPALQEKMVAAGRLRLERDFGEEAIIGHYTQLYARLAG